MYLCSKYLLVGEPQVEDDGGEVKAGKLMRWIGVVEDDGNQPHTMAAAECTHFQITRN
jgi:hypothetical protein